MAEKHDLSVAPETLEDFRELDVRTQRRIVEMYEQRSRDPKTAVRDRAIAAKRARQFRQALRGQPRKRK